MARDYSKYNVDGVGEKLNKRKLVLKIVQDYVEKNNPSYVQLKKMFPDDLQGSKGMIRNVGSDKYDANRFFYNDQIKVFKYDLDTFDKTVLQHLYLILEDLKFDIILFGTGKGIINMPENLKKYLIEKKYNFEIMSTNSAFNTHNILLSEGRKLVSIIKLI